MPPTLRARDEGSATIYAALLAGLLTTLAGAALALGAAILARHRAGAAADLAALSAATHTDAGAAPCDWARRVAAAQRARLPTCACDGPVCVVSATVSTPWGAATVTSRAGPADDPAGLRDADVERGRREADAIGFPGPRFASSGSPSWQSAVGVERRRLELDAANLRAPRIGPLAGFTKQSAVGLGPPAHFAPAGDPVGPGAIKAIRHPAAKASPVSFRALPTAPRPPPQPAPLIPIAPIVAVPLRLPLAESQPLPRAAAAPLRQLLAALTGPTNPRA